MNNTSHVHHCVILPFYKCLSVSHAAGYENERDAPSVGPSPIINIKKEKRETEEETKEILRNLERDNVGRLHSAALFLHFPRFFTFPLAFFQFIDDPFLRSEQRSCPVQLPLAVSGWGFKEEFSAAEVKIEKVEEDAEPMDSAVEGNCRLVLYLLYLCICQH